MTEIFENNIGIATNREKVCYCCYYEQITFLKYSSQSVETHRNAYESR